MPRSQRQNSHYLLYPLPTVLFSPCMSSCFPDQGHAFQASQSVLPASLHVFASAQSGSLPRPCVAPRPSMRPLLWRCRGNRSCGCPCSLAMDGRDQLQSLLKATGIYHLSASHHSIHHQSSPFQQREHREDMHRFFCL